MNSPRIKEFREEDRVQVGGPAAPSPDYNTKKTNYMFLLKAVPGVAEAAAPVEGSTRRARLVVSFLTLLLAVWVLWFYLDEVLGAGGSLLGTKMLAGVVWSWCGEKLSLLHGGGGDEIMFPTSHDLFAFRMKNEEDAHLASDFGGGDYDFLNLTKMNNTRSRMARMATRSSRSTSTSHSLVHDPFTTSFLAVSERTRTSTKRNKKISYARQEVELQKSSDETSTKTVTIKAREDQAGLLAQYVGAQGMPGTGQYDATTSSSCVHDCQDRWKLDLCSPHTWLDTPGFEDAAAAPGTTVIRSNKAPEDMLNWPSDHKLKVIFQAQAGPREFPGVPSDFYPPATDYHVVLTGPPDFRVRNKEGRPGFHVNGASAPSEQYGWTHQRARMKRVSRGQSGPTEQDDGEPVFVKIGLEQGLYGTTGDNNIDCWYNLVCEGKCPCDPTSESEFPAQVTAIAKTSYFGFAAVTRALTNQEHLDTPATAPRATEAQHTHAEFFQDLYQPNLAPVAVSLLGTSLVHVSDEQWSCRLELAPAVPQINHQPLWQFAHEHSTDEGLVDLMKRLYKDSVRHFRVMHRNGLYFPGCHAGNLQVITRTSEEAGGAAAPHEHLPYYNVAALDFSSVTYIPADFHLHSGERDITPSVPPGESKRGGGGGGGGPRSNAVRRGGPVEVDRIVEEFGSRGPRGEKKVEDDVAQSGMNTVAPFRGARAELRNFFRDVTKTTVHRGPSGETRTSRSPDSVGESSSASWQQSIAWGRAEGWHKENRHKLVRRDFMYGATEEHAYRSPYAQGEVPKGQEWKSFASFFDRATKKKIEFEVLEEEIERGIFPDPQEIEIEKQHIEEKNSSTSAPKDVV